MFAVFVLPWRRRSLSLPMGELSAGRPRDPRQKSLLASLSLFLIGCDASMRILNTTRRRASAWNGIG